MYVYVCLCLCVRVCTDILCAVWRVCATRTKASLLVCQLTRCSSPFASVRKGNQHSRASHSFRGVRFKSPRGGLGQPGRSEMVDTPKTGIYRKPKGRKRYKGTWTAKSATRTHRHAPLLSFNLRILSMNLNVASHSLVLARRDEASADLLSG